jgi:hypothetical protein
MYSSSEYRQVLKSLRFLLSDFTLYIGGQWHEVTGYCLNGRGLIPNGVLAIVSNQRSLLSDVERMFIHYRESDWAMKQTARLNFIPTTRTIPPARHVTPMLNKVKLCISVSQVNTKLQQLNWGYVCTGSNRPSKEMPKIEPQLVLFIFFQFAIRELLSYSAMHKLHTWKSVYK